MKQLFFLLLCTALLGGCQEPEVLQVTGYIEGTVTDYETTQSIAGVMVDMVSNSSTTFAKQSRQTGNDGKFAFKDLEAGSYKLSFSRSGYLENSKDVTIIAGQTVSSDVALTPFPFRMQGSTIVEYLGAGGSVVIPANAGVTAIGSSVFRDNGSITAVELPNTLTSIGQYAFYNCRQLSAVSIPSSVSAMGEDAFYNPYTLKTVTVSWRAPIEGGSAFRGGVTFTTLRIPVGTRAAYQAVSPWKYFGTIVEY